MPHWFTRAILTSAAIVAALGAATAAEPPDDPAFPIQWGLEQTSDHDIDLLGAWDFGRGDPAILIVVLDDGLDPDHGDFAGSRVSAGYDYANDDDEPEDDSGHGTHVASIVGAGADDAIGIAGVCPGCSVLALKVLDNNAQRDCRVLAAGIRGARDAGARVINFSVGFPEIEPGDDACADVRTAVAEATEAGVVFVAAAMNDGAALRFPAAWPETIAVGATDRTDARWAGSNYGPELDLVAPGVEIEGSLARSFGATFPRTGTSQAVPFVAGTVGLMLSLDPTLDPDAVRAILRETAEDLVGAAGEDVVGFDEFHGAGRLNAAQALRRVAGVADLDGDGFTPPEDCDESAASVHPGAAEMPGNGRDDDCDPATPDARPEDLAPDSDDVAETTLDLDLADRDPDASGDCCSTVATRPRPPAAPGVLLVGLGLAVLVLRRKSSERDRQ